MYSYRSAIENIKSKISDEISQLKVDINTNENLSTDELIQIGLMVTKREIDQWQNEIRMCEELIKYVDELGEIT